MKLLKKFFLGLFVVFVFCSNTIAKNLFLDIRVDGFYTYASIFKRVNSKNIEIWSNIFLIPDIFKYARTGTDTLEKVSVLSEVRNKRIKDKNKQIKLRTIIRKFNRNINTISDKDLLKTNFLILNTALKAIE